MSSAHILHFIYSGQIKQLSCHTQSSPGHMHCMQVPVDTISPAQGHSITATMQDDRCDRAAMEDAQPTASFDKTIDDFRSGTANYQALLQNFLDQAAAIKDTISKDRAALAQEREHFEQERARVAQVGPPYAT